MTSRAFSCKGTLLRKNLSLYILLSLGIFLLLLYPAYFMLRRLSTVPHVSLFVKFYDLINDHATGLPEAVSSLVAALCVFSYLHNKKRSTFFHSLPCSRNDLFLSSYASGLLLYFLPWLLITAFCAIYIPSVHRDGCRFFTDFLQYSAYRLLLYVVFYSVSVFAMVLCGRGFFGVLSAVALPLVLPITEFFILSAVSPFLYGISLDVIEPVTFNLSPFRLLEGFSGEYTDLVLSWTEADLFTTPGKHSCLVIPWTEVWLFAAGGILLSCLALKLHGIRKEEGVGQTIVFPVVLSVLQYLLTFLASWFLMLLFVILFRETLAVIDVLSVYSLLFFGIPAFFLIRMLLLRTRKVFQKKALFACGIYLLCLGAVLFSFRVDLFGIVRKIPEADRVQQVRISIFGLDYTSQDPQDIQDILSLHGKFLDEKDDLREEISNDLFATTYSFGISYTMEKGNTINRSYPLLAESQATPVSEYFYQEIAAFLQQGDRPRKQLQQLQASTDKFAFMTKDGTYFYPSTSDQQEFFAAVYEDLSGETALLSLVRYHPDSIFSTSSRSIDLYLTDGSLLRLALSQTASATWNFIESLDPDPAPPSYPSAENPMTRVVDGRERAVCRGQFKHRPIR